MDNDETNQKQELENTQVTKSQQPMDTNHQYQQTTNAKYSKLGTLYKVVGFIITFISAGILLLTKDYTAFTTLGLGLFTIYAGYSKNESIKTNNPTDLNLTQIREIRKVILLLTVALMFIFVAVLLIFA